MKVDGYTGIESNKTEIILEAAEPAKHTIYPVIAILLLCIPLFIIGLGSIALLGPDEPRYAEVAREMFATVHFITPKLCGCPWFEKPVLYYWMAAASYAAFGVKEFAARLPSALSAIGAILFLFYGLMRRFSVRFALLVSVVLATSPLYIAFARAAVTDMPLTASFTVAMTALFLAVTGKGRERTVFWYMAWAAAGLAVLAKGLIGILLFGLIGVIWLVLTGDWRTLRWKEVTLGIVVFVLVCAIWYGPVIAVNGWQFIQEFIINHHFKRYLTNEYHHPEPFYFYVFVLLVGSLPWTFFLIPAASRIRHELTSPIAAERSLFVLAWVWLLTPLLFFSVSESKLPGYILPALPAAAILIGWQIERVITGDRNSLLKYCMWLTALTSVAIGIGLAIYLRREFSPFPLIPGLIQWLPLVLAVVACAALVMRHRRTAISLVAGVMTAFILAAVFLAAPSLGPRLSLKELSLQAAGALRPGEQIGFFIDKEYAPVFYSRGRVACGGKLGDVFDAPTTGELVLALSGANSMVIITQKSWVSELLKDARLKTEQLGEQDDQIAFRVSLR